MEPSDLEKMPGFEHWSLFGGILTPPQASKSLPFSFLIRVEQQSPILKLNCRRLRIWPFVPLRWFRRMYLEMKLGYTEIGGNFRSGIQLECF